MLADGGGVGGEVEWKHAASATALATGMDKQLIDEDVAQLVRHGGIRVAWYLPPHSRTGRPVNSYACTYPCAQQLKVMYVNMYIYTQILTYINKCVCLYS